MLVTRAAGLCRGDSSHGRRRSGRFAFIATLCAALVLGGLVPAAGQSTLDELREEVRRAQAERERAEDERAQLQDQRRQVEAERESLQADLEELRAKQERLTVKLEEATAEVERLVAELARLSDEVDELEREVASLEDEAAESRDDLGDRVRALFKGAAPNEYLGMLDGASATDTAVRTHYLTALSRNDRTAVEVAAADARRVDRARSEYEAAVERQEVVKAEAEEAKAELDRRLAEVGERREQVETQIAERQQRIERLAADADEMRRVAARAARAEREGRDRVRAEKQRIAEARAQREREEAEAAERRAAQEAEEQRRREEEERRVAQAERASRSSSSSGSGGSSSGGSSDGSSGGSSSGDSSGGGSTSGGLACPQDHPRSFTDTWGAPRGGGRSHQGTDIFGNRGGRVFAITDGVIEFTRTGSTSGLFLSLRGDDGDTYWYMHLQSFRASPGQRVSAGQVVATNGDTGNARGTSPHIHFEHHPGGGGPVNPYPLLRRACG